MRQGKRASKSEKNRLADETKWKVCPPFFDLTLELICEGCFNINFI